MKIVIPGGSEQVGTMLARIRARSQEPPRCAFPPAREWVRVSLSRVAGGGAGLVHRS